MSQADVKPRSRARRFTLNSDGKRHPLLNAAAAYSCIAGVISCSMSLAPSGIQTAQTFGCAGNLQNWASIDSRPFFGGSAGFRYSGEVRPFEPV